MSEQSTPIVQYNKEGLSQDIPLSPTPTSVPKVDPSRVDIMTANKFDLQPVIEHLGSVEEWVNPFCAYILDRCDKDSIEYTRFLLNSRKVFKEQFQELVSTDASIRAHHTFGEKSTSKTEVAQLLKADYVGRYPHFMLVAARRYMIVNVYPDSTFTWTEGQPCYYNLQLVVYPWAIEYTRLCQAARFFKALV